jgi:hypothetical protein
MQLLLVGDGPRDGAAVPHLVEGVLSRPFEHEFTAWREIRLSGKGYGRKLLYLIRRARDHSADGVVATVDADKDPPRMKLRTLQAARDADRQSNPPFPIALGEAIPHLEAWLLDDAEAVREVLQLPNTESIPNVARTKDPKNSLNALIGSSDDVDDLLTTLSEIARRVRQVRCAHANGTGFSSFYSDVQAEFNAETPRG